MADHSSHPKYSPSRTQTGVVKWVIALRRQGLPGRHIAHECDVSAAIVSRILRRAGLNRLRYLDPAKPIRRYQRDEPGELIHIDIKKLGKFSRIGHRITGDRTGQSIGIKVTRVMSDTGSCYKAREFANACKKLKLKHIRTRPYTPKTNRKAERFIQTALREWAYARAYDTSEQRKGFLPEWTHMYNWHRPHSALKYKTPISVLNLTGGQPLEVPQLEHRTL